MKFKRGISSLLIGLLLVMQSPLPVLADDAATAPTDTQTTVTDPAPAPEPSPAPVADPTPAPAPAVADPAPPPAVAAPAPAPTITEPTPSSVDVKAPSAKPKYVFDPTSKTWVKADQDSFSWDAGANAWLSPLYYYNPRTGWYYTKSVTTTGTDQLLSAPKPGPVADSSPLAKLAALLGANDPSNNNTGADSTNNLGVTNTNNALINLLNLASVTNNQNSVATSGDAGISGSTGGGDATSGMATVLSSLVNLLNSGWSWATGGLNYFVKNIFGDHTGDITLAGSPSSGGGGSLGCPGCGPTYVGNTNTGADSTNNASVDNTNGLTVNNQSSGSIENNLNLLANSGDASIDKSTGAGNATSGDALTELNILNLINSSIAANQSFFGLINILGSLDGDILFPAGFLDGATSTAGPAGSGGATIANNNTGADSTNTANYSNTNNTTINNSPSAAFNNNVNLGATSGNATIGDSTGAGSATTGDATTNSNLANLYNSSLFGDNAVLVLVNVMGHWMGGIMNMPGSGGSTSALLTGNAVLENNNTGAGSTNNASYSNDNNLTINNSPTGTITNNINAGAVSGDASITNSTGAGNATSGDAHVASNIANIFNTSLNLKKWFGVLMINVLGDWNGSVNKDTTAGGLTTASKPASVGGGSLPAVTISSASQAAHPITSMSNGGGTSVGSTNNVANTGVHVAAATAKKIANTAAAQAKNPLSMGLLIAALLCMIASFGLWTMERKLKKS